MEKKFKSNKKSGKKTGPAAVVPTVVSKAEKKVLRQQANHEWKILDRMAWSDKDANPRHTLYYKSQLPVLESEWSQFHAAMASDLPVTFRISERCSAVARNACVVAFEKWLYGGV